MSGQSSHLDYPAETPTGYDSYPEGASEDVEQQDRLLGESFDGRTPVRNAWLTELFENRISIYFSIIA